MGYIGSAWATLACYFFMVCLSWLLGRFYYPVAYPLGKIGLYLGLGLGLYFADQYLLQAQGWNVWITGTLGLLIYLLIAGLTDVRPLLRRT